MSDSVRTALLAVLSWENGPRRDGMRLALLAGGGASQGAAAQSRQRLGKQLRPAANRKRAIRA